MAAQADDTTESAKEVSQTDGMIDTSETSRSSQKVELDLDDAPFLEEEEEVKPEPSKPKQAVSLEPEQVEKPSFFADKKKVMIIGAAAFVVLLVVALGIKFLFFKGKSEPATEKTEHAAPKEQVPDNATTPEVPEVQIRLEPFWVEQNGDKDEIRFLIVRILLITTDKSVAKEFEARLMPARNAIFYYLKNKDVQFLSDEHNVDKLKAELLMVINQYVTDGKFETLMFEEYVVK